MGKTIIITGLIIDICSTDHKDSASLKLNTKQIKTILTINGEFLQQIGQLFHLCNFHCCQYNEAFGGELQEVIYSKWELHSTKTVKENIAGKT